MAYGPLLLPSAEEKVCLSTSLWDIVMLIFLICVLWERRTGKNPVPRAEPPSPLIPEAPLGRPDRGSSPILCPVLAGFILPVAEPSSLELTL